MFERTKQFGKKVKEKLIATGAWIKRNVKKVLITVGIIGIAAAAGIDGNIPPETTAERMTKMNNRPSIEEMRRTNSTVSKNGFTKTYQYEKRHLLIQNTLKTKSIEMELLSAYNIMIPAGDSTLIAEIKLIDWNGREDFFDELGFYDKKNDYNKVSKTFTYKYAEEIMKSDCVPIPEEEKEYCFDYYVGDWDNATVFKKLSDLPNKDIRVGIFTKTTFNEKIEWLPIINGFSIYEWAAYDVAEIDDLEHDTYYGGSNSIAMIDSTHFILVYRGTSGYDGYLKTFSIDGNYNITEIDSFMYDSTYGQYGSVVVIDSTHFIFAYKGPDGDGFISTFSIDGNYDEITLINELEHDTTLGQYNSLVKIDDTHFILAYQGTHGIKTFSIDGNYAITEIDALDHDTNSSAGGFNSLVMIDSTHFILAYAGHGTDGFLATFSIDGNYDNITEIDEFEHDIVSGYSNSLVKVDSTHFMLAYANAGSWIKVFSIDGSYDDIAQVNSLKHDTVGDSHSLIAIDSTHYMLAYSGLDGDGYLKTFSIVAGVAEEAPYERRFFNFD